MSPTTSAEDTTSVRDFASLDITPQAESRLDVLFDRLTGYEPSMRKFRLPRKDFIGPISENYAEFDAHVLADVELPVRIYTIDGHQCRMVVCEEYAQQLDEVRQLRLAGHEKQEELANHAMRGRLLPEELIHYLDELPDSSFFSDILLLDWENPDDLRLRIINNSDTYISAAGTFPNGEVRFYRTCHNQFVRTNLFHEWVHQLQDHFPESIQLFNDAVDMEWRIYVPNNNTHALRSYGEHWAVTGEELLQLEWARCETTATKAPLRASVFLDVLEQAMLQVPESRRSIYHEQFLARIDWAKAKLAPPAVSFARRKLGKI